ncbi:PspC domain-containing protein [Bacillus sp. Marseille-P3661]|uniref:PspC domain-containing protein n=1 Tax=Bacillus sp. Marseille-P3661 TaxID=1936234 RepID=UPI000C8503C1|nr:PspC domain-containing protein [Bacillus sp. Marseille-P3661]
MKKKLYRTRNNKKVAGILGGLAQYLGVDAALLRVIFVLLLIFTAFLPLALAYFVLTFVIPYDDGVIDG